MAPTLMPTTAQPSNSPTVGCGTNRVGYCRSTGDPHLASFDSKRFDFQGGSSYNYIVSCSDDFSSSGVPFIITGEHKPSASGRVSWIRTTFVTLFNSTGDKQFIIRLAEDQTATFLFPDNVKNNAVNKGKEYLLDNLLHGWYFEVFNSGTSDLVFIAHFLSEEGVYSYIKLKYRVYSLQLYMSECYYNSTCGLCGSWDDNKDNDFENAVDVNEFGNLYCNNAIAALSDQTDHSLCPNDSNTDSFVMSEDCELKAIEYCVNVWNVSCSDCLLNDLYSYNDFKSDCEFDACATSDNSVATLSLNDSIAAGYFDAAIETCQAICKLPTLAPTELPSLRPTVSPVDCSDEFAYCNSFGDPHINSFDGAYFHFMGRNAYDYVTSCVLNETVFEKGGLPLQIIGDHIQSSNNRRVSFINYVFVLLYDSNGVLQQTIRLGRNLEAVLIDLESNGNTTGSISKNVVYNIDSSEGWYFVVSESNSDVVLKVSFGLSENDYDIKVKFRRYYFQVWVTSCLKGEFSMCGLCGIYDNDKSNDLHIYSSISNEYSYFSEINWFNSHLFGDSWCNEEISLISPVEPKTCSNVTDIEEPSDLCLNVTNNYCSNVWNDYCADQCLLPLHSTIIDYNEWFESCQMDSCAISKDLVAMISYNDSIAIGYFNASIAACNQLCEKISISPTNMPSKHPIAPTNLPSKLPTSQPTTAPSEPTIVPSKQPTAIPSKRPTQIPSNPTNQPTKTPSFMPIIPTAPETTITAETSEIPTQMPSKPTSMPSLQPAIPTLAPILDGTNIPTQDTGFDTTDLEPTDDSEEQAEVEMITITVEIDIDTGDDGTNDMVFDCSDENYDYVESLVTSVVASLLQINYTSSNEVTTISSLNGFSAQMTTYSCELIVLQVTLSNSSLAVVLETFGDAESVISAVTSEELLQLLLISDTESIFLDSSLSVSVDIDVDTITVNEDTNDSSNNDDELFTLILIIAGAIGLCLVGIIVGMIVHYNGEKRRKMDLSNNVNTNNLELEKLQSVDSLGITSASNSLPPQGGVTTALMAKNTTDFDGNSGEITGINGNNAISMNTDLIDTKALPELPNAWNENDTGNEMEEIPNLPGEFGAPPAAMPPQTLPGQTDADDYDI